jgi:hypothetical protein
MMTNAEAKQPFVAPHIHELYPGNAERTREYLRLPGEWSRAQRMGIVRAMSSLQGKGMKREIQRAHPDWPPRKVGLEIGRLTWGWEIAPPLYGPLEEEARARGESPVRALEFRVSWGLSETPADEPLVMARRRKRSLEEARKALGRLFSAEPCG